MVDYLLVAVPTLGGIILLIASIVKWISTRSAWYAIPAMLGLLAANGILTFLDGEPGMANSINWVMGVFFFLLGLIFYRIAGQRTRTHVA